jgi:hypothetical protein
MLMLRILTLYFAVSALSPIPSPRSGPSFRRPT